MVNKSNVLNIPAKGTKAYLVYLQKEISVFDLNAEELKDYWGEYEKAKKLLAKANSRNSDSGFS